MNTNANTALRDLDALTARMIASTGQALAPKAPKASKAPKGRRFFSRKSAR